MRAVLLARILALLLCASTAARAGTFVQVSTAGDAAAGTAVSTTLTTTAGNLLHVFTIYRDAGEGTGQSVSGCGLTWNLIATPTRTTRIMAHYYAANISGGSCTVTLNTPNSNQFRALTVVEISGLATTSPLDVNSWNTQETPGTGSNAVVSGSATATQAGYLSAIGVQVNDISAGSPPSAGTGFTDNGASLQPVGLNVGRVEHLNVAAGSHQATFTSTAGNVAHTAIMAIFKDAAGGSGLLLRRRR